MIEAARAATCPIWSIEVSHNWRSQDGRMAAWAWPASVALSSLAGCRTGRTAAAARVSVVATEALGELLLSKLLRLVEADNKLFSAQSRAIHRVHRQRG